MGVAPASPDGSDAASWKGDLGKSARRRTADADASPSRGAEGFLASPSFAFLTACVGFRGATGGSWTAPPFAKCYPNKLSKERDHSSLPGCLPLPPLLPSFFPLSHFSILPSTDHH